MPNSSTHTPACLIAAGLSLALPLVTPLTFAEAAQVAVGCALGVIVTPDLDLVNTLAKAPVVGWFYGAYWKWYEWAIPHRDKASHAPIVGTLGRVAYLTPAWVALWALTGLGPGWIIAGLAGVDVIHVVLDAF